MAETNRGMTAAAAALAATPRDGFIRQLFRSERAGHAALLALGAQGLVLAANLVTGVITARALGAEGRGLLAAVVTWPPLLAGIATAGLPLAAVYHLRTTPAERDRIITAAVLASVVLAAASTVAGWLLVGSTMRHYPPDVVRLAMLAIACTGFYAVTTIMVRALAAIGRYRASTVANALPAFLYLALLLAAVAGGKLTLALAVGSLMLPGILIVGWVLLALHRAGIRARFDGLRRWVAAIGQYALRVAPSDFCGFVLQYIDRIVLIPLVPVREIGLYAVAFSLSRLIAVLEMAVSSVTFPAMSGRPREETKALADQLFRLTLYGTIAAIIVTFQFGGRLLSGVFGAEFGAAALLLHVLMAEAGLQCLGTALARLYLALGRPGFVSVAQLVGLALVVPGLLLLVPQYGALGAAWALLGATLLRLLVLLGGLRPQLGLGWPRPWPVPDDLRFLLARLR